MEDSIKQQLEEADELAKEFLSKIRQMEEQSRGHMQVHVRVPVESGFFFPQTSFIDSDEKEKYKFSISETEINRL
jgi:hypothetical protein